MSKGGAADTIEAPNEVSIETAMNDIAGIINSQYGALIDVVVELQSDPDRWCGPGVWTAEQYLAWRMGLSPTTAAALTTVAGRADDLPVCVQAFRDGKLSLDQMASIARKAPWWTDAESCEYGITLTVTQLRRVMSQYPFPHLDADGREIRNESTKPESVDGTDPNEAAGTESDADVKTGSTADADTDIDESYCHWYTGDDGRFRLTANLDAESGEVIGKALSEAHDQLFGDGYTDVNGADALLEVCERSLDTIESPSRRNRFKIPMFLEANGSMTGASGRVVPDSIRQHITCDGTITPVLVHNGLPVSVGRAQHIVPDRTRTLIERRDLGVCRVPGCNSRVGLEVHHIIHWEHDGPTDTWNLILICGRHHRMHHRSRLGITGNADHPDGVTFANSHGNVIRHTGAAPNLLDRQPAPPPEPYQHPLGERLNLDWVLFNPPEAHRRELLESHRLSGGTAANYLDSFKRRN